MILFENLLLDFKEHNPAIYETKRDMCGIVFMSHSHLNEACMHEAQEVIRCSCKLSSCLIVNGTGWSYCHVGTFSVFWKVNLRCSVASFYRSVSYFLLNPCAWGIKAHHSVKAPAVDHLHAVVRFCVMTELTSSRMIMTLSTRHE